MQNLNIVYELISVDEPNPADGTGASWHYSVAHDDKLFSVDISHNPDDNKYWVRILWDLGDSKAEVLGGEAGRYDSFYFALTDSIAWIWNWCMELPEQWLDDHTLAANPVYDYPTKLTISVVDRKQ
jgi:hypothetical protein